MPDIARHEAAINACKALGLDFGAVDLIQDIKGNYYVLEINTAPGLEGATVANYAAAFTEALANA
jgi:glutathione synthase/RimK-type ligase-like ATP-grasp enzyme